MTTYRLMDGVSGRPGVGSSGTTPPTAPTSYSGDFLAGTMFSVLTEMLWFEGYWWWCPTGGDTGAQKFALWNRYSSSAESLVSGSVVTSGTLTAGAWNYVALSTPVQLAPGALYVAATGWTSVHGFPDTNDQFGSGQPYASGITNGPLTAWSDLGASNIFPAAAGNYNLDQGLFGTGGTDPSLIMPNGGSNSANFWVDVQVSDTAPSGYSGSYRLWPNTADLGNFSNDTANNFTLGTEFSLSEACTINNVWFYSPSGVSQLPTEVGVYQVSDTTLVASNSSPSWSGAAGSGWVKASLSGSLSSGVNYKVVVLNGAGSPSVWNAAVAGYWSTGFGSAGLTSGPITAPDTSSATSPGQETYNLGASVAYPNTNAGPYHYGVDIEVTPQVGTPHTDTASLAVTPALTAASAEGDTASLAVTPALTADASKGGAPRTDTASLAVTPALAAASSDGDAAVLGITPTLTADTSKGGAPHTDTGALTVTPALAAASSDGESASLAVTPTFQATPSEGEVSAALLSVSPSFTADGDSGTEALTDMAGLIVSPSFTAEAAGGAQPPDDVATGAWKHLSPLPAVAAVLGAFAEDDAIGANAGRAWLFSGNMLVQIKGSQASAVVLSDYGGWAQSAMLATSRYRRLRVDVWTDPVRDASGNITVTESNTVNRCLHVFNVIHRILQRTDADIQVWGDMVTVSCQLLAEPAPAQVSDGDSQGVGVVMGTAVYAVEYSGWTDSTG